MCGFIDGAVADCTNASRSSLNGGRAGSSGGKHIFFSGYMRADATFTSCRSGCTLGPSNANADHAQGAAVVYSLTVYTATNHGSDHLT